MKKLSLFLFALAIAMFSCKPEIEKPTVVTKSVGGVTETAAEVMGQVTADGGAEVTERGVCWNTEGSPQIIDFRTVDGSGIGSFTATISDLKPNTTYYVRMYATNEAGTSYGEEKSFTTEEIETPEEPEEPETGEYNGHEYVDLGLSVKWATCNVGANYPEEYGDYFAFGETSPKAEYTEGNYCFGGGDAARANWHGAWRMPTKDEMDELIGDCGWEWMTQNGVNGWKVTSSNGNSIFLPAAGIRSGSFLDFAGETGCYWSSTPLDSDDDSRARSFSFSSVSVSYASTLRYAGLSIRPVFR